MANLTTAANAVRQIVPPEIIRGIFTNDTFWQIFASQTSDGDSSYRWNLRTNGIAGQAAVESDPFAAEDSNAYSRPALAYRLYNDTCGNSDHLKAALKNNQAAYFDALGEEVAEAVEGVKDAVMTQWLGSTGEGILLAIDSTGTYATLDHAAITGWTSYEDTTSAAQSHAMLDDMRESLRDNERRPKGPKKYVLLAPENQITNYTRLSGPGVRDGFQHMIPNGDQPNADIGANVVGPRFGSVPFIGVPDMNDNTIIMCCTDDCVIFNHERTPGDQGWVFEEVPRGGFHTLINVSWFGLFVVKDPFRCGKLSAVTT